MRSCDSFAHRRARRSVSSAREARWYSPGIGCPSCHVPVLITGANPVPALRFRVVPAFTDLLLHDMGPDLADICLGQAEPSEFRTEPLMGLRFATAFLHDGRATTISRPSSCTAERLYVARNRFYG